MPFSFLKLSFFVVLINPLGWHMLIHMLPMYIPFLIKNFQNVFRPKPRIVLCYTVFFLFALFSYFFIASGKESTGRVIRYFYEVIVLTVFLTTKFSSKQVFSLIKFYIYSCVAITLKMLIQHERLPVPEIRYTIFNFIKHMDPNFLAALFIFPSLILFHRIVKRVARKWDYIFLGSFLVAVFASGSRGGLIAILIGFALLFFEIKSIKMKILVLTLAVCSIAILSVYEAEQLSRFDIENLEDGSNQLRFHIWDVGLQIFQSSPWIGRGANSIRILGPAFGARVNLMAHNTFIEILADYGMIGLFLWISPYFLILKKAIKRKNYLVISILISTFFCAFFISAQNSAFWWQNLILCSLLLRFKNDIINYLKIFQRNEKSSIQR